MYFRILSVLDLCVGLVAKKPENLSDAEVLATGIGQSAKTSKYLKNVS